jgi:hypothetical protein
MSRAPRLRDLPEEFRQHLRQEQRCIRERVSSESSLPEIPLPCNVDQITQRSVGSRPVHVAENLWLRGGEKIGRRLRAVEVGAPHHRSKSWNLAGSSPIVPTRTESTGRRFPYSQYFIALFLREPTRERGALLA